MQSIRPGSAVIARDVLIRDGLGLMVRALEKKEQHAASMASAEARAARTVARSSRRS